MVVLGDDILGKPSNQDEAAAMLRRLAGRRHEVMTAYRAHFGGRMVERVVSTGVSFRSLDPAELRAYLDCGEWQGKAGAYAIQGIAGAFAIEVHGSFSNVVGLPLAEVHSRSARTGGFAWLSAQRLRRKRPVNRAEQIAANLHDVRARIARAEASAGRIAGSARLVAVSKTVAAADILAALAAGQEGFWRKLRAGVPRQAQWRSRPPHKPRVYPGRAGTSSARFRPTK